MQLQHLMGFSSLVPSLDLRFLQSIVQSILLYLFLHNLAQMRLICRRMLLGWLGSCMVHKKLFPEQGELDGKNRTNHNTHYERKSFNLCDANPEPSRLQLKKIKAKCNKQGSFAREEDLSLQGSWHPLRCSVVHLYLLYFRDYKLAFQLCCFRGIVTVYWATRLVLGLFRLYPSTSSGFVSVSGTKLIQFQMICPIEKFCNFFTAQFSRIQCFSSFALWGW